MKTEREYTKDIEFHAKRVDAREKVREFRKKRKKATLAAAIVFIAACPFMLHLALGFYNKIMPLAAVAAILGLLLIFFIAYMLAGSILFGGLKRFFRLCSLTGRWQGASKAMETLEEKVFEKTAYSGDVEKAEQALLELSEDIIKNM